VRVINKKNDINAAAKEENKDSTHNNMGSKMHDMQKTIFFRFADHRPHHTTIQEGRQQD